MNKETKKFNNPAEFNNPAKVAELYDTDTTLEKNIMLIKLVLADIAKIKNMPLSRKIKIQAIMEMFTMIKDNI
ncbi:MAG: hypothetical protein EOM76_10360 [Sphingobacteriia bacterium]|nr:hypothetical protein [Sphingobacteriia bacterium]